jgi:hypothetical protein
MERGIISVPVDDEGRCEAFLCGKGSMAQKELFMIYLIKIGENPNACTME